MKSSPDMNLYCFECPFCGCVTFSLKPDGNVECQNCCKRFAYIHAMQNWIPSVMDVEKYMTKVLKKKWDKEKGQFVDTPNTPPKARRIDSE